MRDTLKALDAIVTGSAGMSPAMRREFRSLIAEGNRLAGEADAVAAAERRKIETAQLPECSEFTGAGSRCASCRVHKSMHG